MSVGRGAAPVVVPPAGAGGDDAPLASPRKLKDWELPAGTVLLPGWKAAIDPSSGKTYFYNKQTGQRKWRLPREEDAPPITPEA